MSRLILTGIAAATAVFIASVAAAAPMKPLPISGSNAATPIRYHGGCPPGYKVTSHGGCKMSDYLRHHPGQNPYNYHRYGYQHRYPDHHRYHPYNPGYFRNY